METTPIEAIIKELYAEKNHASYVLDATGTLEEEIQKAPDRADLLINAPKKGTYFAFLKRSLADASEIPAPDSEEMKEADKEVAREMYQYGYSYESILDAMVYSPAYKGMEVCDAYDKALSDLAMTISPIMALPEIAKAKPLGALDRWAAFEPDDEETYYYSCLRSVYDRNPVLSLREADCKVVALLESNGFKDNFISKCVANSMEFPYAPAGLTDEELLAFNQQRNRDIHALLEEGKAEPFHERFYESFSDDLHAKHEKEAPSAIYQEMFDSIKEMKKPKMPKAEYWNEVLGKLYQAIVDLREVQPMLRATYLMGRAIEKGSKEFSLVTPDNLQETLDKLDQAGRQNDEEKKWKAWADGVDILGNMAQEFLRDAKWMETHRDHNATLQLESIQSAPDLDALPKDATSKTIYEAAMHKTLMFAPTVGLWEGDILSLRLLEDRKYPHKEIEKVFQHSPRYHGLSATETKKEVTRWLKQHELAQKQERT